MKEPDQTPTLAERLLEFAGQLKSHDVMVSDLSRVRKYLVESAKAIDRLTAALSAAERERDVANGMVDRLTAAIQEAHRERDEARQCLYRAVNQCEAAERERDRYADCLRTVCHHLELPQSESGQCDDPAAYDRALSALDELWKTTERQRAEHAGARYRAEAERDSLREQLAQAVWALKYAFGAAKNELVARGLPLEWSPNSGLGVMERALVSCGASVPRSGQFSAPTERLGPGNTEAGGAPRSERDAARKRSEEEAS